MMKIIGDYDVYTAGAAAHASYRIPSLAINDDGVILAFCEGRKNSSSDSGYIEIIVKKSSDNGKNWSQQKLVIGDGTNTFGNPCTIFDGEKNRLHLVCNFNYADGPESEIKIGKAPRLGYYMYSDDFGDSWSTPLDITLSIRYENGGWLAFGPCHGIKLKSGRLAFPCNQTVVPNFDPRSHIIYSDDGGITFARGEDVALNTNECAIEQLNDGRLYINMRSYIRGNKRARAYSSNGGITWGDFAFDDELIDPICQGSTAYIEERNLLFTCNAASKSRENLTMRLSRDGGLNWEDSAVIHKGPSAYSDLVIIDNHTIGCLYECGEKNPYEKIKFAVLQV